MKKLLLLFGCAASLICPAQNSTVFQDNMNRVYQYIDRTPITTGLLLDYGLLLTDVAKFNGTVQSNNYVNRPVWSMLYSSLYFMKFNANAAIGTPGSVNTQINNYLVSDGAVRNATAISSSYLAEDKGVINLIGLHYQYQQFKADAATTNLVYVVNNQIYDTPNRLASPYEIKDAFAIAPTTDNLQGNNHIFRLRPELFYSNVNKPISSLKADFSDGLGMRNVGIGAYVQVNYTTDSVKTIVFQLTYSDGQVLQSRSLVNLSGTIKNCTNCRYSTPPLPLDFPNTGINFPVAAAQMGTGRVTVATAGTDGKLDKPLIIVEGFDPNNQFNYYSLLDRTINGNLSINMSVDYPNQTFAQLLEANSYDLVFLDFNNSTDDIKKNAYLLENLISWVNQQVAANGSTQKNIVLGISMGGLVARYALRDMELRNVNHNTRLYCSLDSPHQGANVPLGVQAAVRYLAGYNISIFGVKIFELSPDITAAYNLLSSPAASQMLTYQLTGSGASIAIDNTLHTNFQTEYSSKGMPRLWGIRNVAISNGSECASTQGFSPYSQMLTANGSTDFNYLGGMLMSFAQVMKTSNPLSFFEGFLTTSSNLQLTLEVRSLPNQQAQRILYFDIYYHKEILFGLAQSGSDMINFSFNSSASMLPLDSNPGGIYDINRFARIPQSVAGVNLNPSITRFGFVPTISSLDVGSGTQPITSTDYLRTYSPTVPPAAPKNVPFHNFFTNPLANENHATLTINNAKWLWQEMQGTTGYYSCSYKCAGTNLAPTISGSSLVCNQATYALSPAPNNASATWFSNNPDGLPINSTTGAATRINSYNGAASVSATVTGSCGSAQVAVYKVHVGNPTYKIQYDGVTPVSVNGAVPQSYTATPPNHTVMADAFTTGSTIGRTTFKLSNIAQPTDVKMQYQDDSTFVFSSKGAAGSFYLRFNASNACGTNNGSIYFCNSNCITSPDPTGASPINKSTFQVSVSPNPSKDILKVAISDNESTGSVLNQSYELIIMDRYSRKVFSISSNEKHLEILVDTFPSDIYYLNVFYKNGVLQEQIVINH